MDDIKQALFGTSPHSYNPLIETSFFSIASISNTTLTK